MKKYKGTTDFQNTLEILEDLQKQRLSEMGTGQAPVMNLYGKELTCTGFICSNPNAQIAYAEQNGFFGSVDSNLPPYD